MIITIFYIPVEDKEEATLLGERVIAEKLAACANIFPIQSLYPWEGKLESAGEFVLVLKTLPQHTKELEASIKSKHSYQVPCIMHWQAEVNEEYGRWIEGLVT